MRWVASSQKELGDFLEEAQEVALYALRQAQAGKKHLDAKPLKGFNGASVIEIVVNERGNAYRVVYTVKLPDAIYVLCAFRKKATRGVRTPQRLMDLVRRRLQFAIDLSRAAELAEEAEDEHTGGSNGY